MMESTKKSQIQTDQEPLEEIKPTGRLGIRRVTEEEATRIKGQTGIEKNRQQNLKMLFNLRPGVFEP